MFKNAAARAGLDKDISPHTLRHSYGLLGHSSVTTTQIYTHVTAENLRQVWREAHPRA